jgi:hypothetical protein
MISKHKINKDIICIMYTYTYSIISENYLLGMYSVCISNEIFDVIERTMEDKINT